MKKLIVVIGLGVSLVSATGEAVAQETVAPTINADGRSGTSNAGLNPAVDADGPTLIYGDIDSGPGTTVIGPPAAAPVASDMVAAPPPGTSGDITATDGNAAALGPGDASAAPGTVTGGTGTALLGWHLQRLRGLALQRHGRHFWRSGTRPGGGAGRRAGV
jgi:hypothetical protein